MPDITLMPDQALIKLRQGNERFVKGWPDRPNQSDRRRREIASGQNPIAVILGCADSRVPPEVVFDQGLGDLFVVRVAGNLVDDIVLGSIEYAVEHLHVPLVMVLGHDRCGAVSAAVEGGASHDHVHSLIAALRPAVEIAKVHGEDVVSHAINANVRLTVSALKSSEPILAPLVNAHAIKIVGARYHLESGLVELLDENA